MRHYSAAAVARCCGCFMRCLSVNTVQCNVSFLIIYRIEVSHILHQCDEFDILCSPSRNSFAATLFDHNCGHAVPAAARLPKPNI
jgi:hypothetical protein